MRHCAGNESAGEAEMGGVGDVFIPDSHKTVKPPLPLLRQLPPPPPRDSQAMRASIKSVHTKIKSSIHECQVQHTRRGVRGELCL